MASSRRTTTALACLLGAGLLVPAAAGAARAAGGMAGGGANGVASASPTAPVSAPATTGIPADSPTPASATPAATDPTSQRSASARPRSTGPTRRESVSLQLAPRDAAGLAALAKTGRSLPRATRLARLDAVIAGTGRAHQVGGALRDLGLTVTASDDFTVTASGPAARVDALFGSARGHNARLGTAQTLPQLPSALRGLVTAGWGGDDTRPAVLSHAITAGTAVASRSTASPPPSQASAPSDRSLSIAQARAMYGISTSTTPPSSTAPIVATLQFAPWPTATQDLNAFAANNGIYPTSYNAADGLSVDTSTSESCMAPGNPGSIEAALDQEALLVAAPQLRQRMYVAPNCGNAQDDAITHLVQDVRNGAPIVALSTSWGRCEPGAYASDADVQADQQAVQAALAVGVTVFAASGDQGAFDCVDTNGNIIAADAVDAPAVVPGVIGVGGTSGTGSLATWNTYLTNPQTRQVEHVASGGGYSCDVFTRPAYQPALSGGSFPHNAFGCTPGRPDRMVPDIAADAGAGLDTIDEGGTQQILGTSFGAPLSAGGFAQTLLVTGHTQGIGDITGLLYGSNTFHDVSVGTNIDYASTVGYDVATGLGAPVWSDLLPAPCATSTVPGSSFATTIRTPQAVDTFSTSTCGGLQEDWWTSGRGWHHVDAPGPKDVAGLTTAIHYGPSSNYVFYRSTDGSIAQTSWSSAAGWHHTTVPAPAGLVGDPVSMVQGSSIYIFSATSSGGLVQLAWNPATGWLSRALPTSGAVTGRPSAVLAGTNVYVFYQTASGGLVQTYWTPLTGWGSHLLPGVGRAGNPATVLTGSNVYVFSRTSSGGLVQTYWTPRTSWGNHVLPGASSLAADPSPMISGTNTYVFSRTSAGTTLQTYWTPATGWGDRVLPGATSLTGSPSSFSLGSINILSRTTGGALIQQYWTPATSWRVVQLP